MQVESRSSPRSGRQTVAPGASLGNAGKSRSSPRSGRKKHARLLRQGGTIGSPPEERQLTRLEQIKAAEARLMLQTYDRNPILFTGGEGVHLIDEKGDRYLDLLSGIGVNALGYGHPAIERAIIHQ